MFHDGGLVKSCSNSRVEFCDRGPVVCVMCDDSIVLWSLMLVVL